MSISYRFNPSYRQKMARIKRLPKIIANITNVQGRRVSAQIIRNFKDGLRMNNFKLRPLKPKTVERKTRLQFRRPKSPLVALGDENRNSYINMLEIRVHEAKTGKRTYVVGPRDAYHHPRVALSKTGKRHFVRGGRKVKLDVLLKVHERGKTIRRGKGRILLPPRPALHMAYERTIKQLRLSEQAKDVRKAMADLIMRSRESRLADMQKFTAEERRYVRGR